MFILKDQLARHQLELKYIHWKKIRFCNLGNQDRMYTYHILNNNFQSHSLVNTDPFGNPSTDQHHRHRQIQIWCLCLIGYHQLKAYEFRKKKSHKKSKLRCSKFKGVKFEEKKMYMLTTLLLHIKTPIHRCPEI